MSYTVYTALAVFVSLFSLLSNIFPDTLERWGVARRLIAQEGVQRQRRAPVPIIREAGAAGCSQPSLGNFVSVFGVAGRDVVVVDSQVYGRAASIKGPLTIENSTIGKSTFSAPQSCPLLNAAHLFPYAALSGSSARVVASEIVSGNIGVKEGKDVDEESLSVLEGRGCGVLVPDYGFGSLEGDLKVLVDGVSDLEPTVSVALHRAAPPKLVFKLSSSVAGSSITQVAYIDGGALGQVRLIGMSLPGGPANQKLNPGSTLLVNVFGTGTIELKDLDTSMVTYPHKVLWNFFEAEHVVLDSIDFFGTVLAKGGITVRDSRVVGGVFALGGVEVRGGAVKGPGFDGCMPVKGLAPLKEIQRQKRDLGEEKRVTVTITVTETKWAVPTI
ncbi:hypothetical protein SpCBS45565_g05919 [Spizellomyces sp. 'palustris']|nr:hypothetical protein SpCBS45565_g05919 [Spizellomyces sp. 'palustris']